jgi:hypothetical protein
MVKEIVGTQLGAMKFLHPILEEWKSMMQDSEWRKKDAPWWYNERALLSLFAGAIWKCEGWAFEEFATSKRTLSKRGRRTERAGRGDIMFQIGEEICVAEAKQCWPILGHRNHNAMSTVKEALNEARIQSSRLPSEGQKLGIVFGVPCLHESKQGDSEKILHDFISRFTSLKNTTITWVFPREKRTLKGGDGYIYPGIVLMLKPLRLREKSW